MKSLAIRILISLAALLALGAVVLVFWADLQFRSHGPERFHQGALILFADQAERTWAEGQPAEVARFLEDLGQRFRSDFQWLDSEGLDLIGSEDHPELTDRIYLERHAVHPSRKNGPGPRPPIMSENGRFAFVVRSTSGKFRLVEWVQPPPLHVPLILFSIIGLVLGLFGALMTFQVVRPVRKLQAIVEEFGRGNLNMRSNLKRTDEIGDLAESFNRMADQIHLLVERERGVVRSVAHEVRGPLTRMRLLTERLRNGKQVDETIGRLEKEIGSLSQIPDLLLQLSLVESGQAAIQMKQMNLGDFIQDLVTRMEPQAARRDCQIQCMDMDSFDYEIQTDAAILGRSVENVLDNAIRHSPEKSRIKISQKRTADQLELYFRDFGPGVPEQDLASIFRPFFRCDASRTRNSGGLGLGLAITRSCVEALGGKIWASHAEPGLLVTIRLPRTA